MENLRSHFGYLRSEVEYLPRSEFVAVHHLNRIPGSLPVPKSGCKPHPADIWDSSLIRWKTKQTTFHKSSSWPLASGCWHKRKEVSLARSEQHAIVMCILKPTACGLWKTILSYAFLTFLASLLSSSIILLADPSWAWSKCIATFGVATAVALSFLLWMAIYIYEHIPRYPSEWFESRRCPWPDQLVKKDLSHQPDIGDTRVPEFAFFKQAGTF